MERGCAPGNNYDITQLRVFQIIDLIQGDTDTMYKITYTIYTVSLSEPGCFT